jgi:hypothetical protein
MTTVVERDSLVATATALDTAAKTLLEQVFVAKAALENARAAGTTIDDITNRGSGLPRIDTVVSIRDAAHDFLNNGVDADGVCSISICQEAAEEVVALVALVVNDVIEEEAGQ